MKKLISIVLVILLIDTPVAWPATTKHTISHNKSIYHHKSIYKTTPHSYANKGWKKQHKKQDTMKLMDFKSAGLFKVNELLVDDLIKIDDDIVTILDIAEDSTGDIFFIKHENDFGEIEITELEYHDSVELFVITDEQASGCPFYPFYVESPTICDFLDFMIRLFYEAKKD